MTDAMIWVFGCAVVILVGSYIHNKRGERDMQILHEERMKAMEKGLPLPELPLLEARVEAKWHNEADPSSNRTTGIVLTAFGWGVTIALLISSNQDLHQYWPFGLIAVMTGFGFLLAYWLERRNGSGK